jgi:hypothetical protein
VRVKKEVVAAVVAEASMKMGSDPNYSSVMVGGFVQGQKAATQYITAHQQEVGGAEAVINTIFHAALLAECFKRAGNRTIRAMTYADLDHVAGEEVPERIGTTQVAIREYIDTNVELQPMRDVLYLLALAMDWVS